MNQIKHILTIAFVLVVAFFISSCGNSSIKDESTNSENSISENSISENSTINSSDEQVQSREVESIDGIYIYEDNLIRLTMHVMGDAWTGKTTIITGFGSDYDSQNTQYENGIVKGNDLFESSGMVRIGYVSGKDLVTSVAGQQVTLRK